MEGRLLITLIIAMVLISFRRIDVRGIADHGIFPHRFFRIGEMVMRKDSDKYEDNDQENKAEGFVEISFHGYLQIVEIVFGTHPIVPL